MGLSMFVDDRKLRYSEEPGHTWESLENTKSCTGESYVLVQDVDCMAGKQL